MCAGTLIGDNAAANLAREPGDQGWQVLDVFEDSSEDGSIDAQRGEIGQRAAIEVADERAATAIDEVGRNIGAARWQILLNLPTPGAKFNNVRVGWYKSSK